MSSLAAVQTSLKPDGVYSVLTAANLACRYAVRRVVFSPHSESIIASCSYDMTVRLWDYRAPEDALLQAWDHHTEFAVGLDFSTLSEGMLASTGWDEMVYFWPQSGHAR